MVMENILKDKNISKYLVTDCSNIFSKTKPISVRDYGLSIFVAQGVSSTVDVLSKIQKY